MNSPVAAIGTLSTIEGELDALKAHIAAYRSALNEEGVWLFLATLGCWSVSKPLLQIMAFGIAIMIFGARMIASTNEKRSFSTLIVGLEARFCEIAGSETERKAGLFDLMQIQKTELSGLSPFKHILTFSVCWAFLSISFVSCLYAGVNAAVKSAV